MLPLSGKTAVTGINSPVIGFVNKDISVSHVNHRLNSKNHSRYKHHTGFAFAYMADERILMEFYTNAVAAEFFALRGVALLMQSIEKVQSRINPALEVDGVLITMYTKTLHCEEVCQRVYEAFSEKVFHTFISRSIKLPDSTVAAAPVVVYAPEHKTSKEYREVARELIARGIVA